MDNTGDEKKKKKRKSRPGKRDRALLKAQKTAVADGPKILTHDEDQETNEECAPSSEWEFEVDYNDHFETPTIAYEHILPWLKMQAACLGKSLSELVVFDPYFCKGVMVEILKSLGVMKVINENVDFYKRIKDGTIPEHDVLLTNPPYSGEHKTLLLQHLASKAAKSKPFALLLPSYCATKSYWKHYCDVSCYSIFYILPRINYEYLHPEGTGKDKPPFHSAWFVGRSRETTDMVALKPKIEGTGQARMAVTSTELAAGGVRVGKRPSNKQRKKRRKEKEAAH